MEVGHVDLYTILFDDILFTKDYSEGLRDSFFRRKKHTWQTFQLKLIITSSDVISVLLDYSAWQAKNRR